MTLNELNGIPENISKRIGFSIMTYVDDSIGVLITSELRRVLDYYIRDFQIVFKRNYTNSVITWKDAKVQIDLDDTSGEDFNTQTVKNWTLDTVDKNQYDILDRVYDMVDARHKEQMDLIPPDYISSNVNAEVQSWV